MFGRWLSYPSEKYDFVSWDDENPIKSQYMEKYENMMFQTTNQVLLSNLILN